MAAVQMTAEQFQILIATIKQLSIPQQPVADVKSKGSFANCPTRFGGQRDQDAVDAFVTAIETYKDIEQISDEDALKGLPLLFYGIASTWWKGVRRQATTWAEAIELLRDHFSPTKPAYQIYLEIFDKKQSSSERIDGFVCEKRALLAKLPEGRHDEETELDFVYALLDVRYRQHIPRHEIKSFRELLEKARTFERNG